MTISFSDVPAGSVLPIMFNTFDSNGASITITGLAVTDIEIFKGTSMTQRASDAGYVLLDTDGIDLDGITGIQGFSLDLGDNTDAGFYAAGSFYSVVVSAITVDTRTVNFLAATFRISAGENTAGTPVVDAVRISGDATAADNAEAFFDGTGYAGTNNVIPTVTTTGTATAVTTVNGLAAGVITAASIANGAIDAATFAAGAIDAAAIAADASTEINTAVLAILGTPTGASMSADIAAVKVDTAAILVDTGTTLDGRIPAALTAGGNMKSDMLAISGSTVAADDLEESTEAIGYGTVDGTGATTTVFLTSALTPDSAVNDQFNGRVLIFKNDTTTAALRGQATTISDWAHTSAEIGTFTVVALTTAPVTGDTFAIL